MSETPYTGTDNLEVMKEAVNYNRFLTELITKHARPSDRIVDFGAGVGTFAARIAEAGYDVECVEPDAAQREAIAAGGLRVHRNLTGIADSSVDFVYTLNVLEHIDDDLASIRAIGRKLRGGGRLLIYVPAFPMLYTSMDRKVGHVRRYRLRDLRTKVAAAGLTVITAEYVDSVGFFATLVYRLVGSESGSIDRDALRAYDRVVFPVSQWADLALKRVLGKNVLLVAERQR